LVPGIKVNRQLIKAIKIPTSTMVSRELFTNRLSISNYKDVALVFVLSLRVFEHKQYSLKLSISHLGCCAIIPLLLTDALPTVLFKSIPGQILGFQWQEHVKMAMKLE